MQRLIAMEAVRFCREESIPQDEIHMTYQHIARAYLSLPKKRRGKFRLGLERVNKIKQFDII